MQQFASEISLAANFNTIGTQTECDYPDIQFLEAQLSDLNMLLLAEQIKSAKAEKKHLEAKIKLDDQLTVETTEHLHIVKTMSKIAMDKILQPKTDKLSKVIEEARANVHKLKLIYRWRTNPHTEDRAKQACMEAILLKSTFKDISTFVSLALTTD